MRLVPDAPTAVSTRRCRGAVPALLAAIALSVTPLVGSAQTVVKLATLVPEGSVWHEILENQAERWESAVDGSVDVRIYPGGVGGDDPAVVRKMRIGQFQGAALSVEGLVEIDEAFALFQMPLFFQSPAEVFYVLDALTDVLRARLDAKGFVLVNWGYGGWVRLYSTDPIRSVADLRGQKTFLWGGEERATRIYRSQGLQPVGLAATDIMMALQTGMIDAMATSPLAALSFQWYRLTGYQLEPGIAPLIGGTVLTKQAWNRLSAEQRTALLATAPGAWHRLQVDVSRAEEEAIAVMRERGLEVTTVDLDAPGWKEVTEGLADGYRRDIVPTDVYDLGRRARDAYRSGRTGAASGGM